MWNADNDVYICIVEDAFMLYITRIDQKSSMVLLRSALRCSFMPGGKIGCFLSSVIYPLGQLTDGLVSSGPTERHFNRFVLVESDCWEVLNVSDLQEF